MGIIDDKEGIEKEIHINRLKKIQKEAKNDLEKLEELSPYDIENQLSNFFAFDLPNVFFIHQNFWMICPVCH